MILFVALFRHVRLDDFITAITVLQGGSENQ